MGRELYLTDIDMLDRQTGKQIDSLLVQLSSVYVFSLSVCLFVHIHPT